VLTTIAVTPATASVAVGSTQQFAAQGKDQFGNNMSAVYTWTTTGGGTINSSGLFTATTAGSFTVRATSGSVSGTASVSATTAPSVNLALNKPIVASSTEYGTPSAANDGNATTRWASLFTDAQWIYVDLQARYNLTGVVLSWEAAYGRSYDIQVSDNLTTWTNLFSTTTGDGGLDNLTISGTGRYVRMNGRIRGTGWGYSLWEFEVYGTLATARASSPEETEVTTDAKIRISPNPTVRGVTVSGVVSFPATITIYSVTHEVFNRSFSERDALIIDMENLPKGLYFIRIKTNQSETIEKILKN
jgi:hypothetical protein